MRQRRTETCTSAGPGWRLPSLVRDWAASPSAADTRFHPAQVQPTCLRIMSRASGRLPLISSLLSAVGSASAMDGKRVG